jgi:hypothetical protein
MTTENIKAERVSAELVRQYTSHILETLHHDFPDHDRVAQTSYLFSIGCAYGMLMAGRKFELNESIIHPVVIGHCRVVDTLAKMTPEQIEIMVAASAELLRRSKAHRDTQAE